MSQSEESLPCYYPLMEGRRNVQTTLTIHQRIHIHPAITKAEHQNAVVSFIPFIKKYPLRNLLNSNFHSTPVGQLIIDNITGIHINIVIPTKLMLKSFQISSGSLIPSFLLSSKKTNKKNAVLRYVYESSRGYRSRHANHQNTITIPISSKTSSHGSAPSAVIPVEVPFIPSPTVGL